MLHLLKDHVIVNSQVVWHVQKRHSTISFVFDEGHDFVLKLLVSQVFLSILSKYQADLLGFQQSANDVNCVSVVQLV